MTEFNINANFKNFTDAELSNISYQLKECARLYLPFTFKSYGIDSNIDYIQGRDAIELSTLVDNLRYVKYCYQVLAVVQEGVKSEDSIRASYRLYDEIRRLSGLNY